MLTKTITYCGQRVTVACDGQCHKAWGINRRPSYQLTDHEDDYAYPADYELGFAPADPGTTEGDQAKPCATVATDPAIMNKWCVRECERCSMHDQGEPVTLRTFDKRRYNIPRRTGRNPVLIISGGQTGVDRAALDVGLALRIGIGGYVPKGRRAEDGPIAPKYPLKELETTNYLTRTEKNIDLAGATVILSTRWPLTGGTLATRRYAERPIAEGGKGLDTVFVCNPAATDPIELARFVERYPIVNIAGPRESKCPGIYQVTKTFLLEVFR
jgi:hypothetical protein